MSSHPTDDPIPDDHPAPRDRQLELGEDSQAIALRKAWEKTLRGLVNKYNKQTFESFLKPLKPLSFDGRIVVLGAPSAFARDWAEKKYTETLRGLLVTQLDAEDVQVRFVVATPDVQPLLGEKPLPLQQAASPLRDLPTPRSDTSLAPTARSGPNELSASLRDNPYLLELATTPLNDRYTFDNLVVGKSNRLAHASAWAVAQSPGASYNPLFLYGSPGLGKTHLMHAIGNHIRTALPEARIAYVSGETFTNHFVSALRDRRTEDFRRAYRNVDLWLVDDIQTIAAGQKEQTKEEFFHTFNTLHGMKRQIVIASDRPPREMKAMDMRLRSRFEGGLVVDIAPPELEMRMAILQKKAILENLRIPDEVIAYMANLIQSNIRALEGALAKLMIYASLAKSPVTKQLASDVLGGYFVERPGSRREMASAHPEEYAASENGERRILQEGRAVPTLDQVTDAVSAQVGIAKEEFLSGTTRRRDVTAARHLAMYLAHEMGGISVTTLAQAFGCKHHSSISHALTRVRGDLASDPSAAALVARIKQVIEYSL